MTNPGQFCSAAGELPQQHERLFLGRAILGFVAAGDLTKSLEAVRES